MGGKTKYKFEIDIGRTPEVKVITHAEMQGHIQTGLTGTLMEYVDAKLLLDTAAFEFGFDRKDNPTELSAVELNLKYRATIFMSDRIPKGSRCWKAVMEHATEHHDINVKGLKGIQSKAEAILQKCTESMLKDYRSDLARLKREETAAIRALAKEASGKIQDDLFVPILRKSVAIDTDASYRPLEALCRQYGE